MSSVTFDEVEAAQIEGLQAISPRADELRQKWLLLHEQKKLLESQLTSLRDELGATLVESGLQGLTCDGKVVVRLSNVTTVGLDTAGLKRDAPKLFEKLMKRYAKVTRSERITIK